MVKFAELTGFTVYLGLEGGTFEQKHLTQKCHDGDLQLASSIKGLGALPTYIKNMVLLDHFFVVLTQTHCIFYTWPSIPSGNVAPMFYLLVYASFAIKNSH